MKRPPATEKVLEVLHKVETELGAAIILAQMVTTVDAEAVAASYVRDRIASALSLLDDAERFAQLMDEEH